MLVLAIIPESIPKVLTHEPVDVVLVSMGPARPQAIVRQAPLNLDDAKAHWRLLPPLHGDLGSWLMQILELTRTHRDGYVLERKSCGCRSAKTGRVRSITVAGPVCSIRSVHCDLRLMTCLPWGDLQW